MFTLTPELIAQMQQYLTMALVPSIIWGILQIVATWIVFKKAGEAGWKCLIPIYSSYIFFKIADKKGSFWIVLVLGIISGVFTALAGALNMPLLALPGLICMVIAVIINITVYYNLSVNFGHGVGYTLGLLFLNPIFMLILAFGSSQYKANRQ